jgi:hypothetical protein
MFLLLIRAETVLEWPYFYPNAIAIAVAKSCVEIVPFSSGMVIVLVVAVEIAEHSNASFFVSSTLSLTLNVSSTKVPPGMDDVSRRTVPVRSGKVAVLPAVSVPVANVTE